MTVLLNCVGAKGGGGITYLASFLKVAANLKPDWRFVVFLPPQSVSLIQPLPANVELKATEIGYAPWWKRLWWDQVNWRRLVRIEKADVLYSPLNFGMGAAPVPQILGVQNVLYFSTAYQERFLHLHSFPDRLSFRLRRWLVCRSVSSADVVMTPTAAALDDVRRHVRVPSGKAMVNPFGVEAESPILAPVTRAPGPRDAIHLLYVSYYRENKNLKTLLLALRELQQNGRRAYRLVTTLNPDTGDGRWAITSGEDRSLLADALVAPAVEIAGPCRPSEALELYGRCDLFVFPSIVESFGFPLAQAMARGLPVIASDTQVNREICGDAAVYFPIFDYKELALQIERVAGDFALREKLASAGAERVRARFTWDGHVRRLLDAFSELAARRG